MKERQTERGKGRLNISDGKNSNIIVLHHTLNLKELHLVG